MPINTRELQARTGARSRGRRARLCGAFSGCCKVGVGGRLGSGGQTEKRREKCVNKATPTPGMRRYLSDFLDQS